MGLQCEKRPWLSKQLRQGEHISPASNLQALSGDPRVFLLLTLGAQGILQLHFQYKKVSHQPYIIAQCLLTGHLDILSEVMV